METLLCPTRPSGFRLVVSATKSKSLRSKNFVPHRGTKKEKNLTPTKGRAESRRDLDACGKHSGATHFDHPPRSTSRDNVGRTSVQTTAIGRQARRGFRHEVDVEVRAEMDEGQLDLVRIVSEVSQIRTGIRGVGGLDHDRVGVFRERVRDLEKHKIVGVDPAGEVLGQKSKVPVRETRFDLETVLHRDRSD